MSIGINSQLKSAIVAYRKKHNISPKVSDNVVAQMLAGKKPAAGVSQAKKPVQTQKAYDAKSLGLKNTNGAGTKVKSKNGNTYTVVGNAVNGRKIVKDSKGQLQVLAADGTVLKKDYVANDVKKVNQAAQAKIQKENAEYKSLGLQSRNGAGTKVKSKNGNTYTVVGTGANGRKIVKDANGQTQVLAADGTVLKKDYVVRDVKSNAVRTNSRSAQQETINLMRTQLTSAQKSFQNQLAQDGWAADVADGVSVLWGSENRASKVRVDLNTYSQNIQQLQKAAKNGDAAFNAKFKQLYGKDFDQKAMADYIKNPTAANYKRAFGEKNDIKTRVDKYNKSQQQGAEAVKTTAKITAGIAVGIATGGTGFVALGAAAAATAAASVAIDETDRLNVTDAVTKGEVNFREGTDHKKILTSAAWDGASVLAGGAVGKVAMSTVKGATTGAKIARAAINTTGDVAVGAAQEYAETGTVTAQGVVSNAAMSAVGGAVVDGTLKALGKSFSYVKNKVSGGIGIEPKIKSGVGVELPTSGRVQADVELAAARTRPEVDVDVPAGTHVNTDVDVPKAAVDVDVPSTKHVDTDVEATPKVSAEADVHSQNHVDADVEVASSNRVNTDVETNPKVSAETDVHSQNNVDADVGTARGNSAQMNGDISEAHSTASSKQIQLQQMILM